jgi:hypothetical protein
MPARIFGLIREQVGQQGLILREGTIVDATLIAAPPSTKNKARERKYPHFNMLSTVKQQNKLIVLTKRFLPCPPWE